MVKPWRWQRIWTNGRSDERLTVVQQQYLYSDSMRSIWCQTHMPWLKCLLSDLDFLFLFLSLCSFLGPFFLHVECLVSWNISFLKVTSLLCTLSFAFSHPSARRADVGISSWALHPWLDLAQPAGTEATWHPGWSSKQASPVGSRHPGLHLQLGVNSTDVNFVFETKHKRFSHTLLYQAAIYILQTMRSFFWGRKQGSTCPS